jgi:two-component system LytT family sensor kinase
MNAGRTAELLMANLLLASSRSASNAAAADHADRFALRRVDWALILGFWTFLALLTAANRLLDPRSGGFQLTHASAPVALAFINSYLWALLTPPVFWLTSRFSLDRGSRLKTVTLFVVVGVLSSLFVAITMDELWESVVPTLHGRTSRGFIDRPLSVGGPFVNDSIVYMAVLAAGLARSYSLRYRARQHEAVRLQAESARLQAQLAVARLDALRMQLDPHFLFNTLHSISSLVENDPRGVRRMISRLGELLRHTIEGTGAQEVPLRQELELLQRYLDIMEVRFHGRLEVITRVDERALDALVPNLILQPLVENAIKHGVSRVENRGRIELDAELAGTSVVLRVRDNGPGGDDVSPAESSPGDGTGVGLRNTIERLEQLYGDEQSFALRQAPGGGMVAEVKIPYHTRADLQVAAPPSND